MPTCPWEMGFPISGPKIGGFAPNIPLNGHVSTRPRKALHCMGRRVWDTRRGGLVQACAWRRKSVKSPKSKIKAPNSVNFTPSPRRPRRVANSKFCPLRRNSNVKCWPPNTGIRVDRGVENGAKRNLVPIFLFDFYTHYLAPFSHNTRRGRQTDRQSDGNKPPMLWHQ